MDVTPVSAVLVLIILFGAAYLQSATGFGMALVGMAFIPLILPVTEAIAFVSASCLYATLFIMILNRASFSLRRAGPLALAMCLGIPVGYFGLQRLDGQWIVRLLGVVLMGIALSEFFQSRKTTVRAIPETAGSLFGFAGGLLAGAFNVGGPPLVVYAYSRPWSKVETVVVLQTVFLTGSLLRNSLMIQAGEYTRELLLLVALSLPASLAGVWFGKKTLDRLPQEMLRRIVFVLIFVLGLSYAVR